MKENATRPCAGQKKDAARLFITDGDAPENVKTACAVCIRKRTEPGSTTNEENKKTKTAGLYVDQKTGQGDVQRTG